MRKTVFGLGLIALIGAGEALGAEIKREYRSARHLGMGDAGAAAAKGADAIFYNPAGVAEVKGILNEVDVVAPTVTFSANSRDLAKSMMKGSTGGPSVSGGSTESLLAVAKQYEYKPQGASAQLFSGVVFRRAAFGVLGSAKAFTMLGQSPDGLPALVADVTGRSGLYFSFARGFLNENLMLGMTYKYLVKAEVGIDADIAEMKEQSSTFTSVKGCGDLVRCGTANGVDVGLIWKNEKEDSKPRLGLIVHNVGDATYTPFKGGKRPNPEKQTVDVSIGVEPQTKKSGAKFFVDYKDALNRHKENPYKRIHLGGEISFSGVLGIMAGANQGYPTYGAFVNAKIIRIEGGVFTEEVGNYPGHIPDKRFFGRMTLGWAQ